ncbi:putative holin [Cupriavidus taiwanensis]|uniref:Putative PHAGE-RELATED TRANSMEMBRANE PROTEIN holin n=1 Tax=Cupriavidus taiwanensis TaxID=164546 RepID=A0A375IEM2_9BURK|nr:putative holin [Cupriavidus taiwanensis]SPK73047.1 putative PHAGE-RELATED TRANSMEMBRANE PROTEIN holin [Cupriavidus taiwanensis]SPR99501.1 putative PHAGE-RELATED TRANSMEMBRANE PROTEIN; putative holin [Cupriavidus taiwanensis]
MAEPIATSSTAAIAVTSVGAITLLPGVDAATVLGAFAGAAVFVLNSDDMSTPKKLAFLVLSIVAGCLAAPLAAALIAKALPTDAEVSHGVGALVASSVLVKLLLALIRLAGNGDRLVGLIRGNEQGGGK